jgi:hypothetical protein
MRSRLLPPTSLSNTSNVNRSLFPLRKRTKAEALAGPRPPEREAETSRRAKAHQLGCLVGDDLRLGARRRVC